MNENKKVGIAVDCQRELPEGVTLVPKEGVDIYLNPFGKIGDFSVIVTKNHEEGKSFFLNDSVNKS